MNPQDSQSELEDGIDLEVLLKTKIRNTLYNNEIGFSMAKAGDRTAEQMAEDLVLQLSEVSLKIIEAYVTTRVKEAEAEEVEMAADFAEDVLQQFGYNGKSGGLSTLEWAEGIIKRHKKLQALTTTTNGKEE